MRPPNENLSRHLIVDPQMPLSVTVLPLNLPISTFVDGPAGFEIQPTTLLRSQALRREQLTKGLGTLLGQSWARTFLSAHSFVVHAGNCVLVKFIGLSKSLTRICSVLIHTKLLYDYSFIFIT